MPDRRDRQTLASPGQLHRAASMALIGLAVATVPCAAATWQQPAAAAIGETRAVARSAADPAAAWRGCVERAARSFCGQQQWFIAERPDVRLVVADSCAQRRIAHHHDAPTSAAHALPMLIDLPPPRHVD